MAYLCKGCAFEYGWEDDYTPFPKECEGCEVVDGKPTNYKPKLMTNADRIRAMSDELLATQLVQVVIETIKILTNLEMPDDLANEIRANFLKKLQQPAEGE